MLRQKAVPTWPARVLGAAALGFAAQGAWAVPYELVYTGYFTPTEALNPATAPAPSFFDQNTAFTLNARFDDSSPNLAPPSPPAPPPFAGFRAYASTSMSMQVGGQSFSIGSADNPGLSVSIFDRNSFEPGYYGIGIIVDAAADGAGIVGDFAGASPDFTVVALVPTTFTGYRGVGHSSGTCEPMTGPPPNCPHLVTPIVLRDASGEAWNLTLDFYSMDPPAQALNTAQIIAVPEPQIYAQLLAGLCMLGGFAAQRRR